ncbi:carbonic anhydrase 4 isoform X2 [Rhineura floridana]|uniref:carbonic anhydrase 4 isoform X2 n=1 Tax=Rhineura floridana TaxID=261503 RepID=UPI002AC8241B|nr:carbonic anhydrase 4 isoform X2 [Rhineura floridana]
MRFLYFLVLVSLHSPAAASEGVQSWCYLSQQCQDQGCQEPRQWEHLFDNCGKSQQSPINILTSKATYKSDLKPFKFEKYDTEQDKKWTVRNNGHTVQVDLDGSAKIESGGLLGKYKAMQFHFHWGYNEGRGERSKASPGSEHSIDGERYAMELHIVHMKETFNDLNEALSKNGVAVLGFFIKVGKENRYYKPFISKLNNVTCKGNQTEMEALCLNALIPTNTDLTRFYRYNGSLTTPSCNEGVIWTLFETPIELSLQQIQEFWTKLYFGTTTEWPMMDNFRPTQPVGNRVVYKSDSNALLPAGNTLLLIPTATYLTLFLIQ